MNVNVVFGQMLVLLAMMMIGYFAYRMGWATDDMSKQLSKLVVNVFNPVLIVNGVLGQNEVAGNNIAANLFLVIVYFIILIVFSYIILLILRPERRLRSVYRLMAIFSNVGFMAIPIIRGIYGNGAMIYVAFYILAYNLLLYTYGLGLANKAGAENTGEAAGSMDWRKSLRRMANPGVAAALIAVIIFALKIEVPSSVYTFCDYVGNATIPLSMILIGVSVAQADRKQMFDDWRIYAFIGIRMLLLPVGLIFLLRKLPVDAMVLGIFILEMGMPVGSIVSLMIRENGADNVYCTKGIVLSTLASIVTIPIICMFL